MIKKLPYLLFLVIIFFSIPSQVLAVDYIQGLQFVDNKVFESLKVKYTGTRITTDSANNFYVIGEMQDDNDGYTATIDTNFNLGVSEKTGSFYIAKYSSQKELLWSYALGNNTNRVSTSGMGGVVTDANNNVYITGTFRGTVDFDSSVVTDSRTSSGQGDIFLTKINSDGSYAWTKIWGNTADERYPNLAVDKVNGAVYVVGSLGSVNVDLDPGAGQDIESKSGLFISKFDLNGNYLWGNAYGLTVSSSNNIFVEVKPTSGDVYFGTNYYGATIDFDPSAGTDNITVAANSSNLSGFVSILTSTDEYIDTFLLSKIKINEIEFDANGNLFLAGDFSGSLNFNPMGGIDTITSAGDVDAFLSKWNTDNTYAWTKKFGGTSRDNGVALSVDTNNNVYFGGNLLSQNVDFDYSDESDIHSNSPGQQTAFITIVRNDGSYVKTYSWGCDNVGIYGYGLTNIQDIKVDSQGRVYTYGWYYGDTDFDPSSGVYIQKGYYNYASYISVYYPYVSNDISIKPGTFGIAGESYSSDSSLSSLTSLSGSLSPAFNSATYSYNTSLDADEESIAFTPTINEANSRLTINDEAAFSGGQGRALVVRPGSNTFTIKVTAADQTSTNTYTVTVNREKPVGDYYDYSSTKGIGNSGRTVEHNQSLVDANGNFYILGKYSGGSVDFGINGDSDVSNSGQFLLKLDSNQNPLWVKRWATTNNPEIKDMDLDSNGNIYLAGEFNSTSADFDPGENISNPSISSGSVLIEIEANGTFAYAKSWNSYYCSSIAVDSTRNSVYVGGYYYEDADFDPESSENIYLDPNGDDYPYVSKFSLNGTYSWTKTFTSTTSGDYGDLEQMALDSLGNIYVAGEFSAEAMDFDPDPTDTDLKTSNDATTSNGIFLTKINVDGSYAWTKVSTGDSYIGLDEKNSLLTTDSENNVILSGYFKGDTSHNAYLNPDDLSEKFLSTLSSQDPFVQKYESDGNLLWARTFGGTDSESSMVVGIGPSDNIFVGGWYQNYGTKTTDFYPGVLEDTYQGDGSSGFLVSLNKDGLYLGTSVFISTVTNQINSISFKGNEMYLAGSYSGTVDMNPSNETIDSKTASGSGDIFLAKFNKSEEEVTPTPTPTTTPTATPTPTITPAVLGDVLINKISPLAEDSDGEWVELINTTTRRINLENWTIEFSNPTKNTVSLSSLDILPKSGLLTINFSGDNILNDDSGTITLKNSQGTVINTITYGAGAIPSPGSNNFIHRHSDGNENWEASSTPRKGWFIDNSPAIETIDSSLDSEGIETNMAEERDLTRAESLYFERSGQGKIQFDSDLNLTDADVVNWLQNLNSKIDLSVNGQIGLNTSEIQEAIPTQATLTMYNIYLNDPKILVDGADDNAGVVSNLLYDKNAHTLTFNVAHFTTFKAVERSSSANNVSSANNGSASISVCGDAKPASAPDLFQIDTSSKTAKLFFTPISNTNQYVISFSTKPNAEEHGAIVILAKEGVQNFTINLLKANTVYYFKVRGQNGCATGEWSKVMKVTTRPTGNKYTKSFYEYASAKTNFVGNKTIKEKKVSLTVSPEITPSISQINNQPVTSAAIPTPEPSKKRCILWWCF